MRRPDYYGPTKEDYPRGYYRVTEGEIRADDLVWSVMEKKWRRNDDPEWNDATPHDVDGLACVMRKAVSGFTATRPYTMPRRRPTPPPEPAADPLGQPDLF